MDSYFPAAHDAYHAAICSSINGIPEQDLLQASWRVVLLVNCMLRMAGDGQNLGQGIAEQYQPAALARMNDQKIKETINAILKTELSEDGSLCQQRLAELHQRVLYEYVTCYRKLREKAAPKEELAKSAIKVSSWVAVELIELQDEGLGELYSTRSSAIVVNAIAEHVRNITAGKSDRDLAAKRLLGIVSPQSAR